MNDTAFLALNVGKVGVGEVGGLQLFSVWELKPKPRYSGKYERISLVALWLTLCSLCRGPGFNPWSGN